MAHCEAAEEQNSVVLLDACARVQFQEQPAKICFDFFGQMLEHWPDLLVAAGDVKEFWKCKTDIEVLDLFVRRRSECLTSLLKPLGFGYRLVSTSQLAAGHYIENAVRMRRRAKLPVSQAIQRHIRDRLADFAPAQASQVLGVFPTSDPLDLLYALLYAGVVMVT